MARLDAEICNHAMSLPDRNRLAYDRVDDELRLAQPTAFASRTNFPGPAGAFQVMATTPINNRPLSRFEVRRLTKTGGTYRIGTNFFCTTEFTYNREPLSRVERVDIAPNSSVWAVAHVLWKRATATFSELVTPPSDTVTRTRRYKTGEFTVQEAKILIVPSLPDDAPDLYANLPEGDKPFTAAPGFGVTFGDYLPDERPEVEVYRIAQVDAEGNVQNSAGPAGILFPAQTFQLEIFH